MRVIAWVADQKTPGVDIEVKSLETWQADPTLRVVPPNTCPPLVIDYTCKKVFIPKWEKPSSIY